VFRQFFLPLELQKVSTLSVQRERFWILEFSTSGLPGFFVCMACEGMLKRKE
jgi:hypothetical protein